MNRRSFIGRALVGLAAVPLIGKSEWREGASQIKGETVAGWAQTEDGWHHVVVTRNGPMKLIVYHDGQPVQITECYDHALSWDRVREHYDAAKHTIPPA